MKRGLLAVLCLAACSETGPVEPVDREALKDCKLDMLADAIGGPLDTIVAQLPDGTRVLRPGAVVTQDYRITRANVAVTESGRIERMFCG